jgi:hypothetical protein
MRIDARSLTEEDVVRVPPHRIRIVIASTSSSHPLLHHIHSSCIERNSYVIIGRGVFRTNLLAWAAWGGSVQAKV